MEKITTIKSTVLLKFKDRKEENVVFGRCIYGIKEDDKCDVAIRKFTEDKTGNSKETRAGVGVGGRGTGHAFFSQRHWLTGLGGGRVREKTPPPFHLRSLDVPRCFHCFYFSSDSRS